MKRVTASTITGLILVGIGVLLMLENFDMLGPFRDVVMAIVFGAGGIACLGIFASRPEARWTAIPGFILLGLAALLGLQAAGFEAPTWGGSLFLGALSLGFWAVYLAERTHWWPIIPGGVLLTLAVVAGIAPGTNGIIAGTVFWLGLALTFGMLFLVGAPHPRATWPLIPAGVSMVLGIATFGSFAGWIDIIWPAALIVGGLLLVVRAAWPRTTTTEPVTTTMEMSEANVA